MITVKQRVLDLYGRPIAEILAALKALPPADRLDVLAIAIRAAFDSGLVDYRDLRRPPTTDGGEQRHG